MWRAEGTDEVKSATKRRPCRDFRDDIESSLDGVEASDTPDENVKKFDNLLRRIETERKRVATSESSIHMRKGTNATSRRSEREGGSPSSTSAVSYGYDFASRARELRMATSSERTSREKRFGTLPRDMTLQGPGRRASPSPLKSRVSYADMPSRTLALKSPESPSTMNPFHNKVKEMPRRSLSNVRTLSASPMSLPSSPHSQEDFRLQVKKFHRSLVSAHDTISTFEKEVRHLKARLDEKEECISSLECRNTSLGKALGESREEVAKFERDKNNFLADKSAASKRHSEEMNQLRMKCDGYKHRAEKLDEISIVCNEKVGQIKAWLVEKDEIIASLELRNLSLNETLAESRDEVTRIEKEKHILLAEKGVTSEIHIEEIEKLRSERDGYKKCAKKIKDISAECNEKIKEIERKKQELECSNLDKDDTISSLRNEVKHLNEELADGTFVSKKLEAELDMSRDDHASLTKAIADLEVRLKESSEEYAQQLREKDKEIETLHSEVLEGNSMKQNSELMKNDVRRLEVQLDEAERDVELKKEQLEKLESAALELHSYQKDCERHKLQKQELFDKVKNLEKHLACAERAAKRKDEVINQLESAALDLQAREKDLARQLSEEQRELARQREKLVQKDAEEQKTATALERAIKLLEASHKEDIRRLKTENHNLGTSLKEAEECMKTNERDLNDMSKFKFMLEELQEVNSNLAKQVHDKDDQIKEFHDRVGALESKAESNIASAEQRILELKNQVSEKQDQIAILHGELASKRECGDALPSVKHKMFELENNISAKDDEVTRLQKELASKQDSHDREERTSKKLVELATLYEENKVEIEKLRAIKSQMRHTISSLEKDNEMLKEKANDNTSELESQVSAKQIEIDRLQEDLASKRASQDQEEKTAKKLVELAFLYEENMTELEQLRTNKNQMLRVISALEKDLESLKEKADRAIDSKFDQECQVQKFQKDAKRAWARVSELEESLTKLKGMCCTANQKDRDSPWIEGLGSELASVKELAKRDEQSDSRNGIADYQKVIISAAIIVLVFVEAKK